MTEGIIYKVFGKIDYTFIGQIRDNFEEAYADMIIQYFEQSQIRRKQELIAEIKKEFESIDYKIIEKLIGDTK